MTRRLFSTLAGIALALVLLPAPAAAGGIQRLQEFARDARTLSGNFTQTVYDSQGRKTQESAGELYFSRPGKFRWIYRKPYEQLIVGDGSRIWIYDSDLEQVTVKKTDRAIGESPAALLAGSNEIDRYFDLRDAGTKDGVDWLEATPKSREGSFDVVRLGFRGKSLEAMELQDNFGQRTSLRFAGLRHNPSLKAELFRFKPPRGVDVLGDTD